MITHNPSQLIGQYLTLQDLCCCTNTYLKFQDKIDPYPKQIESVAALKDLAVNIIDPIIEHYGLDNFVLTYGFCSHPLSLMLKKKDPFTKLKYGVSTPNIDQHSCHEVNSRGKIICDRLGAAIDFKIKNVSSSEVKEWIVKEGLPFDRLYFYGESRSIYISFGPDNKRSSINLTLKQLS